LENADDRQVNDNGKMEKEEAAAVYIALFVNASIRFRNSSRINIISYPSSIQDI
jgi:hypothetical protein